MTKHNNTADGTNGANDTLSPFAKAMSEVFTLSGKVEGASIKLLDSMFNMEATFGQGYVEKFVKATGKDKTLIMHGTMAELIPTFDELKETAQFKMKELNNPSDVARMAEKKLEAQKKLKTAENTFRNVMKALAFLRIGPAASEKDAKGVETGKLIFKTPIVKIETKGSKIRFSTSDTGWYSMAWTSFTEAMKYGENTLRDIGWMEVKKAPPPRADQGTSVVSAANKAKATNALFQGAGRELSTALSAWFGRVDYDSIADSDMEAIRNLEVTMILKVYGGKDGLINIEALVEQCEGYNASIKKRENIKKAA